MKYWLKKLFFIVVAVAILTVGINLFLAPHHIAAGGLTGLAIILETITGWDRSNIVFVANIGILVITLIFLGKETFLNTVIGATLLPFMMRLIPNYMLLSDTMLSMITGSVVFGVGVSMMYANNASSGGTSIPPLIFKKYFGMNPSIGLFLTDSAVVLLSIFVFGIESFFYAVFSIFITSVTMNYIEVGLDKKRNILIISDKSDAILQDILNDLKRGATVIPVKGGYKQENKDMIMVTLSLKDHKHVIDIVNRHDEKAFIITYAVTDVHGLGFSYQTGSV